jgi:hypothetical protein
MVCVVKDQHRAAREPREGFALSTVQGDGSSLSRGMDQRRPREHDAKR